MDPEDRDAGYMALALKQARCALEDDEVPVGAVIVASGTIIGRAFNQTLRLKDPTAHAEILAITQAAAAMENERLTSATMYVSLEPCAMCAGALVLARVDRIVFGARDEKAGACGSVLEVIPNPRLNHRPALTGGVMARAAEELLAEFFRARRTRAQRPDRQG